jgi:hypothetical protein
MLWWRKGAGRRTEPELAGPGNGTLIKLEHVTKVFKGDADEETRRSDGENS